MTMWTCPMHPEVLQSTNGSCPKCGMSLQPSTPAVKEEPPDPEYIAMHFRLFFCTALSLPVLTLSMSHFSFSWTNWAECLFASPVVLWGAWPFFTRAAQSIKTGHFNMFTLIGLGVGVAYWYSILVLFFPHFVPIGTRGPSGEIYLYFEAAAVITTLVLLGQVLELRAHQKTGTAIKSLLNLAPKTARLVKPDGSEREIDLESIAIGDILRILPGQKVPVDALVSQGTSYIDESMMTGEATPVHKKIGDQVVGGTLNGAGSLMVVATKIGKNTLLAQIIDIVSRAQKSKAPAQKLADTVSNYFVPGVVLVAVAAFIFWFLLGPEPKIAYALVASISVLIIACPCALGLATPISIMIAMGRGARAGVLFKNAEGLEMMRKVTALIVDKTGTLTEGHPALVTEIPAASFSREQILFFAASLEQASEHPFAKAFLAAAFQSGIILRNPTEIKLTVGSGIEGVVDGRKVKVGTRDFTVSEVHQTIEKAINDVYSDGQTSIYLAIDGQCAGIFGIADPIKQSTAEAVRKLRAESIHVVMVSGDTPETANHIAKKLDIDDVFARVKPPDKATIVQQLKKRGYIVAMAGDGINDAPALAQADVGIAMGTGTDVAIKSADVTLVKGDLLGILRARELSRITMLNIKQNLWFAFLYNGLGIPLAAGLLYPISGLLLSPMIAALAMSLSSVSVIANSLRIYKMSLDS